MPQVYRGIREPYLHLMHDVMSLHEDSHPLSHETTGREKGNECDDENHQHFSKRRANPLLREWHRSGNPFKILGPQGVSKEKLSEGSSGAASNAVASAAAAAPSPDEKSVVAGVGFGRLPMGMDVDDDPDQASSTSTVEEAKADAGSGGGGMEARSTAPFVDELEQEEKRCGLVRVLLYGVL